MCFSAEADLVVGALVVGIGIDALRHRVRRRDTLLAAIPVVLGGHQLVESFVWWGLEGRVPHSVLRFAVWAYIIIAFGLLPVMVPLAVAALEPAARRRRVLLMVGVGAVVSVVLMFSVATGSIEAAIEGHHISYTVDLWHGGSIVALYVAATCGSLLLSHHRRVRWFGLANAVAVAALVWVDKTAFISLWCAWAALASIAIALHLRAAGVGPAPPAVSRRLLPQGR